VDFPTNRAVRRVCLLLVLATASSPLHGQDLSTTFHLGAGPEPSSAAGLRLEVVGVWGAYGRAALRSVLNACDLSLPASCKYPSGHIQEYALGVARGVAAGKWQWFLGAGGGVLSWQDGLDPFVDLNVEARRALGQRLSFLVGINAVVAPGVERERRGNDPIVGRRTVRFTNLIVGLAVRVW
jgi:hypothetical protein